ncbi:hypothetical protein PPERSA_06592 [Pseudocohnilembus persalinus]|uniref:EF-hand domain-containing protein n=1 Tax=Pseudocohnilembus persalinus TaxID=266149 RepID=A0A0V0QRK3_PSEPJ|nr:hypothetical protein PPERSA_06592 [Pseudocohnilembus persalinus]|eukprot:KRX04958.1 hypothetical protein PPERSA_06592 [Pseudocohnilembus persalinus]
MDPCYYHQIIVKNQFPQDYYQYRNNINQGINEKLKDGSFTSMDNSKTSLQKNNQVKQQNQPTERQNYTSLGEKRNKNQEIVYTQNKVALSSEKQYQNIKTQIANQQHPIRTIFLEKQQKNQQQKSQDTNERDENKTQTLNDGVQEQESENVKKNPVLNIFKSQLLSKNKLNKNDDNPISSIRFQENTDKMQDNNQNQPNYFQQQSATHRNLEKIKTENQSLEYLSSLNNQHSINKDYIYNSEVSASQQNSNYPNNKDNNQYNIEKEIASQYSTTINNIINTLQIPKVQKISNTPSYYSSLQYLHSPRLAKESERKRIKEEKKNQKNQQKKIQQMVQQNLNLNSNQLEDLYKLVKKKKKNEDKKMGEILEQEINSKKLKNPIKLKNNTELQKSDTSLSQSVLPSSKNKQIEEWQYKNKEEYLEAEGILQKTSNLKNLSQLDLFYEKQLQQCQFVSMEQEEQGRYQTKKYEPQDHITRLIKGKNKIKAIADYMDLFKPIQYEPHPYLFTPPQSPKNEKRSKRQNKNKNNSSSEDLDEFDSSIISEESEILDNKNKNNYQIALHVTTPKNTVEDKIKLSLAATQIQSRRKSQIVGLMGIKTKSALEQQSLMDNSISLKKEKQNQIQQELEAAKNNKNILSILVDDINQKNKNKSFFKIQEEEEEKQQLTQQEESNLENEEILSPNSRIKQKVDKFEIDFPEKKKQDRTHIDKNIKKLETKKEVIRKIGKVNMNLQQLNIPQILNQIPEYFIDKNIKKSDKPSNFTRRDIHQMYILYKALHEVTSQRYPSYKLDDGLDYDTYRNGIYQVYMYSEELAQRVFRLIDYNFSGFMDWQEFIKLMVSISAKTLSEKINLFIKIADEDGNGSLSWEEIYDLAKICLSKYIKNEDDGFLEMLCEYYTKLIFQIVNVDVNEEIPLELIKQTIINSKNAEGDLLCMFCGADI